MISCFEVPHLGKMRKKILMNFYLVNQPHLTFITRGSVPARHASDPGSRPPSGLINFKPTRKGNWPFCLSKAGQYTECMLAPEKGRSDSGSTAAAVLGKQQKPAVMKSTPSFARL